MCLLHVCVCSVLDVWIRANVTCMRTCVCLLLCSVLFWGLCFALMCVLFVLICLSVCLCVPQDALSDRDNGLPPGLLEGCRVVLKERQVVQQLMGKCEGISRKMLKDATVLIERGTGSTKQPAILNRR